MKIFFDSEFTGLHKDTTLISIGMVAENEDSFYAEFDDYNKEQLNDWLEENVIANLSKNQEDLETFANTVQKGGRFVVWHSLMAWLDKFDEIEFISDVCHYDFVLLIDLICRDAISMPKNISPICHDINYDIASWFNISDEEAFNKNREDILEYFNIMIDGSKHNAIYDAKVIAAIYNKLKSSISTRR